MGRWLPALLGGGGPFSYNQGRICDSGFGRFRAMSTDRLVPGVLDVFGLPRQQGRAGERRKESVGKPESSGGRVSASISSAESLSLGENFAARRSSARASSNFSATRWW